jgi:hypothetical protein
MYMVKGKPLGPEPGAQESGVEIERARILL